MLSEKEIYSLCELCFHVCSLVTRPCQNCPSFPPLAFSWEKSVKDHPHHTGQAPAPRHPLHYGSRHLTLVLQTHCKQEGDVQGIYSHNSNYSEYGFEFKKNSFFTANTYESLLQTVLLCGFHKE